MNWYRFAIPEMPPPLPSKSEEETRSPCPAKPSRPRPELERIRRLSHTSYTTTAETMPTDEGELSTTEQGGMRLVRHPLRGYERSNLKFIQGGFGSTDLLEAGVIRSFNVLIYFDGNFRLEVEKWVAQVLRPGGLFICDRDDGASLTWILCWHKTGLQFVMTMDTSPSRPTPSTLRAPFRYTKQLHARSKQSLPIAPSPSFSGQASTHGQIRWDMSPWARYRCDRSGRKGGALPFNAEIFPYTTQPAIRVAWCVLQLFGLFARALRYHSNQSI